MTIARRIAAASTGMAMLVLAGCQDGGIISLFPKADMPIPPHIVEKMKEKRMAASSPILLRIFKEEDELEVWKQTGSGRYDLLETFEICKWSGQLGPKHKEGDRQAPEGFYTVNPYQMNPNSDYYLSFNIGFPNAFDRAHERTGSHLMVHGDCSSAGCYSMTDERMGEIYALAREAFKGGQENFQVQAFPFRMTPENMAKHKDDPNFGFWQMLKEGSDHFEITRHPPKVDVCDKRYVFNRLAEDEDAKFKPTKPCPETTMPNQLALAYSQKVSEDEKVFEEVIKKIAFRDFLSGRVAENEASSAVVTTAVETTAEDAPLIAATTGAAEAAVPVPEPSPNAVVEAQPAQKKNWLQRLFSTN